MTRRRQPPRGRRRGVAGALAAAAALALAGAAAASVAVRVRPAAGVATTTFTVSFRTPDRTGAHGSLARHDVVMAGVAGAPAGCVASVSVRAPDGAAGARVGVALAPGAGRRWCPGRWSGRIEELETPICRRGMACPQFIILRGVIGRFALSV